MKKTEEEGSQKEVKYFKGSMEQRHKATCTAVESTTATAKGLDPVHIVSSKFTSSFNFDILAKFHNYEVGNLCRTDNLITSFGLQMYRNVEAKKSKKEEKRKSVMSDMRRLAHLLLEFREQCETNGIFGDAEYKITVLRQKELRMPARLPDEDDVKVLKEWLENKIKDVKSKFQFITSNEYAEIRDVLVCRLTLFNAQRGGEPSRLLLSEWDDAENGVWFTQDSIEKVDNPIEQKLLCH
ncbi:unnamed protein product [Mytilus coruscus]|uniref:Uncharacterized protein n=1 Tax=Mytilus coruscus TaxID=42192 RepID=A0A6J8BL52_MYTCO|nr:unnamed protein product [Mytilus coruscus]